MKKYLHKPRWRYLLSPLAFFSILPGVALTFLSFGCVDGVAMCLDFVRWCSYEDEDGRSTL